MSAVQNAVSDTPWTFASISFSVRASGHGRGLRYGEAYCVQVDGEGLRTSFVVDMVFEPVLAAEGFNTRPERR